jgi:hypothetical protein
VESTTVATVGRESGEILKCEPRGVRWTVTQTHKNIMRDGHRSRKEICITERQCVKLKGNTYQ